LTDKKPGLQQYLKTVADLLESAPLQDIEKVLAALQEARGSGKTVFVAGNGGSAATASHVVNDLVKTLRNNGGKPIRAIALADNKSLITAIGNDSSFDEIFEMQLSSLAREGDLLIVISVSGSSPNIVRAVKWAKSAKLKTIGLLGRDGGQCKALLDVAVVVPEQDYGPVEDAHVAIAHAITTYLRDNN
jgi:D-sedoheptulose 7-phosphate isomerase